MSKLQVSLGGLDSFLQALVAEEAYLSEALSTELASHRLDRERAEALKAQLARLRVEFAATVDDKCAMQGLGDGDVCTLHHATDHGAERIGYCAVARQQEFNAQVGGGIRKKHTGRSADRRSGLVIRLGCFSAPTRSRPRGAIRQGVGGCPSSGRDQL